VHLHPQQALLKHARDRQAQASTQTYNQELQATGEEMETLNEELKAANQ
jgi:hypothetical protein